MTPLLKTTAIMKNMSIVTLVLLIVIGQPLGSSYAGEETAAAEEPSTLSVAPLDHVDYPLDRPPWIDDTGDAIAGTGDEDVLIAVTSGPAPSPESAREIMEVMAQGAVENYVEQLAQQYSEPIDANEIQVDKDWIGTDLISRQYEGTMETGEMVQYESACLLRIGTSEQQTLEQLIQNHRLKHRLAAVGAFAGMGLIVLLSGSIVFGWASSRQSVPDESDPH